MLLLLHRARCCSMGVFEFGMFVTHDWEGRQHTLTKIIRVFCKRPFFSFLSVAAAFPGSLCLHYIRVLLIRPFSHAYYNILLGGNYPLLFGGVGWLEIECNFLCVRAGNLLWLLIKNTVP